jgi:2-polyprenyl-6-methoxyphenol hydroxylase-like FAD-dependent oxidoreductase
LVQNWIRRGRGHGCCSRWSGGATPESQLVRCRGNTRQRGRRARAAAHRRADETLDRHRNRCGAAPDTLGYFGGGQIIIAINRGEYWQCGTIIDKGGFERLQAEGLPAFRSRVAAAAPFLATSLDSFTDWEQVKLLSVRANRLRKWWLPGLLCIGDAAHAMSPVGGIGVNYATADAVAAANALAGPLRDGRVGDDDLRAVQKRRQMPTKVAQWLQGAQTANLARLSKTDPPLWIQRLMIHPGPIKRLMGRVVGLGFRREHIHTADQQDGLTASK